jgi:hypothetical protein
MNEIFKHPADQMRKRIVAITHLLDIALNLQNMQNFNAMSTIACLLCSHPQIRSLHKTFKSLNATTSKKLSDMEEFILNLKKPVTYSIPPIIPPLSIILRDITYTEEIGKTWLKPKEEGGPPILNFRKMIFLGMLTFYY